MSTHDDPKKSVRAEIASLVNLLKEQSGRLDGMSQTEIENFLGNIEQLYRKTVVFGYVNALPEKQEVEISIPQPKDISAEKDLVPPVIMQSQNTEQPEIPVVPVPDKKEAPVQKNLRDIHSLISFNEKLMFSRTLFAGNTQAYEDALAHINNCVSFSEAESFLFLLKEDYHWKEDNEALFSLLSVVKRRFS